MLKGEEDKGQVLKGYLGKHRICEGFIACYVKTCLRQARGVIVRLLGPAGNNERFGVWPKQKKIYILSIF